MVSGVKGVEAQHRSEELFNATMILFDNIIDILALAKMNAGSVLRIVVDDDSRHASVTEKYPVLTLKGHSLFSRYIF